VVHAFVDFIQKEAGDEYQFTLRETETQNILEDLTNYKSEIGVLYLNDFNRKVMEKLFKEKNLVFTPLFTAQPHVFLSTQNPLAEKESITLEELEDYPYLSYEQGEEKYLAVDFSINLEIGSINRDDIYRESLKEQFKKIQRKLKFYGKEEIEFEEFVRLCFPKIKATYYVSAPSFRVVTTEYNGYKAISNMYIRPEKTIALSSIIPKELDIFFVGDFLTNGSTSFVVKGIELIDNSISKPIETKISCNAVYVLKRSIDRKEYPSFLDNNTIINLTEKTCPVYELDDVISILDDWGDYIEFRGYYLEEQSKKNEKINKVEVKKAYSISRSEYKKNLKDYSELLLDGIKSFEKRDEVILSEKVENSTEISLIKVEISRNLSEINQNSVEEGKMSLYERELRKFSRDSVALSPIEPRNMKNNFCYLKILYRHIFL